MRVLYFKYLNIINGPSYSKNADMSGSRLYPRAPSPLRSIIGKARLDILIINTTRREELEETKVNKVKREFKIKLLDIYNSNRVKLIP